MAYEDFNPIGGPGGGIPRGKLSLSARGMARLCKADLAAVGIADRVTILVDRDARSIALREPLEIEQGQTIGVEGKQGGHTVWLAGAMKSMGLKPADFHGWHDLKISEDRIELRIGKCGSKGRR